MPVIVVGFECRAPAQAQRKQNGLKQNSLLSKAFQQQQNQPPLMYAAYEYDDCYSSDGDYLSDEPDCSEECQASEGSLSLPRSQSQPIPIPYRRWVNDVH